MGRLPQFVIRNPLATSVPESLQNPGSTETMYPTLHSSRGLCPTSAFSPGRRKQAGNRDKQNKPENIGTGSSCEV